jgi:hypothetical protein
MIVDAVDVRNFLDYSPSDGLLTWKISKGAAKVGRVAGCLARNARGYSWLQVRISGRLYAAHRLAWMHYYGQNPDGEIDHVNQNATDNRIDNLRVVTHAENARNQPMKRTNTSGITGVYWESRTAKWRAEVKVDGKKSRLGRFENIQDAASAVVEFRAKTGFTLNHGAEKRYPE